VTSLRDGHGCLTEAQLDALEAAGPGQAPEDLARHLADCGLCQNRLLARAGAVLRSSQPRASQRRLWLGAAVVLAMMLAALISLLATLSWLQSAPE
jgi:hypothetical protein